MHVQSEESRSAVAADGMEGLSVLQIRRQVWRLRDLEFVVRIEEDPLAVGVDAFLLDRLVLGAEVACSDALIVLADGDDGGAAMRPWDIAALGQRLVRQVRWVRRDRTASRRPPGLPRGAKFV